MSEESPAKAVVITGASTGIGRACALRLVERGVRVFAGVRSESDAAALEKGGSGRLTAVRIDVTAPDSIAAARRTVGDAVGPNGLDGLVNNAGIYLGGPLEFTSLDELRAELEVNLLGPIALTQALLPLLRSARGRIVNVSSISGRIALPFVGPYAASKFALEAISDAWRVELRPWGIRVALVEPGEIDTPMRDKVVATLRRIRADYPPEAHELYGPVFGLAERQQRRGAPPERVADAVEHALLGRRPRRRYLVGADARLLSALRRLPLGLRDRLIARELPSWGPAASG
jgi:NAD(P)-dependent dehydrogenase (short-subunit alcohol dehydrogenase family)